MLTPAIVQFFSQLHADSYAEAPSRFQLDTHAEVGLGNNFCLEELLESEEGALADVAKHIKALAPHALANSEAILRSLQQGEKVSPLALHTVRSNLQTVDTLWLRLRKAVQRRQTPGNVVGLLGFGFVAVQLRMTLYRAGLAVDDGLSVV